MAEIHTIDIKEFRHEGLLQEVNRLFFHPLGLAMAINVNKDGTESLGCIWDYRDDQDGIFFGEGMVDKDKITYVADLKKSKRKKRLTAAKSYGIKMKRNGIQVV